jgi:hypothetical protein
MLRRGVVVAGMMLLICGSLRPARLWPAEQDGDGLKQAQEQSPPVTVVVFDFGVQEGMGAEAGRQIADALSARLAQEKDLRVVPRTQITAGLQKEGLEPPAPGERVPSVEAGNLLGAELAVFGQVAACEGASYLIAKVVSTEDLSLSGVIVKSLPEENLTLVAERAAVKLGDLLNLQGKVSAVRLLTVQRNRGAHVTELKKVAEEKAKKFRLPSFAVVMSESHLGNQLPQSICEAATNQFLLDAGLDARSCGTPQSQQWARSLRWEANERGQEPKELPAETQGVDILLVGHGWSSPTPKRGAYGKLAICDARVEVRIFDRAKGLQLGQGMYEGLALARTEEEAARKALQRAGEEAGMWLGRGGVSMARQPLAAVEEKGQKDAQGTAGSE